MDVNGLYNPNKPHLSVGYNPFIYYINHITNFMGHPSIFVATSQDGLNHLMNLSPRLTQTRRGKNMHDCRLDVGVQDEPLPVITRCKPPLMEQKRGYNSSYPSCMAISKG